MDNEKMLDDELLNGVSGGNANIRKLTVDVDLPELDDDVKLKVYYDGMLHDARAVLPIYIRTVTFSFTDRGIHRVDVKLDDFPYRSYELDFDNGTVGKAY